MKTLTLTAAALLALSPARSRADAEAPAPPNPITVQLASGSETIYPFTTHEFPLSAPDESDPVNLVFEGAADPREVRAALLSVDGDRTAYGFPSAFPFNCTWSDAGGDEQAVWAAAEGWQGGAVQLGCGPYAMRFHLRLFRQGGRTLGGVHMDLQVPNTTVHQVLSWELPRLLIKVDMLRSGLLGGAPYETSAFGPTPSHRTIPAIIFNGLPVALRAALGLPLGNQAHDVPIPCSGKASVFDVQPSFAPQSADLRNEFDIVFNQVIPKPFCSSGSDYVRVEGPVHFALRAQLNPSGRYEYTELISGLLEVTPVNPLTGQAIGPTAQAAVFENHRRKLTDSHSDVQWSLGRTIFGEVPQTLFSQFSAGQHDRFAVTEDCGPSVP